MAEEDTGEGDWIVLQCGPTPTEAETDAATAVDTAILLLRCAMRARVSERIKQLQDVYVEKEDDLGSFREKFSETWSMCWPWRIEKASTHTR